MRHPRRQLAMQRRTAGFTQESLAARLGVDRSTIARWEAGETEPQPWLRPKLAAALGIAVADVARLLDVGPVSSPGAVLELPDQELLLGDQIPRRPAEFAALVTDTAEHRRQELHDVLTGGLVSTAALDDWEQTVWRYGVGAKDQLPPQLLADLFTDVGDLQLLMQACRSASALRRLTRVAAQLAGLICLTLIKLDDRTAFRRWARTARLAATETDDLATISWVLAQEAYGHFYGGDTAEAVTVAQQAQLAAGAQTSGRVGAVLAAALEARAHAVRGSAAETRAALNTAESYLTVLALASMGTTAFGYNEAQLRFHESNALTHLGDTAAAWQAQDRALQLVAPTDFMDRAFTELDRAVCLAKDGDAAGAVTYTRCQPALPQPRAAAGHHLLGGLGRSWVRCRASREPCRPLASWRSCCMADSTGAGSGRGRRPRSNSR